MSPRNGAPPPSSPPASIDDIQRRLLPPPSSSATFSPSFQYSSTLFGENTQGNNRSLSEAKERRAPQEKKRLQDYLDPVLLSAISAKIHPVKKENRAEARHLKREAKARDFDWPVDELKLFLPDSVGDRTRDLDPTEVGGDGEGELCTPFGRFERAAALKRFKLG